MSAVAIAAKRIVTCDPARASSDDPLGVIEDGAVVIEDGIVRWTGPRADVKDVPITDYGDRVITPGLVDAHTHSAWIGSRHTEYALRMAGADYLAIAAAGGGIVASARAIEEATVEAIASELTARLARMAELGVTSVEVKSGYGLEPDGERKQLQAMAKAAKNEALPHVVPTFLALHALPARAKADRAGYVQDASKLLGEVADQGLAHFIDAYVDAKAFTVDEARIVGSIARKRGIGVRLHVGQFADVGGAELCAELGARSADHLENVGQSGIDALVKGSVFATLLPVASLTLRQAPPPVAKLRDAGVRFVVASDANPGTAPTESLPLAIALAVSSYGLTPAEAILGATRYAAASLDRDATQPPRRGWLGAGAFADLVVWDLPHEVAIVQPWGAPKTHLVLREGRAIAGQASRA